MAPPIRWGRRKRRIEKMITDEIAHGETYDIEVSAEGADDLAVTLDGTWGARFRVLSEDVTGDEIAAGAMTIAEGVATATIDTGDAPWVPGTYYYDVRLTDPDGNEYVSDTVKLVVNGTQTIPA